MDKFSQGEELSPFLRIMGAEDPTIGFNLLIGSFGLFIHLGVIGRGESDVVLKDTGKFTSKGRGKLGTSVGDDGVIQAETFEYIVEKELGNSIHIDHFGTRGKNCWKCAFSAFTVRPMGRHFREGVAPQC